MLGPNVIDNHSPNRRKGPKLNVTDPLSLLALPRVKFGGLNTKGHCKIEMIIEKLKIGKRFDSLV